MRSLKDYSIYLLSKRDYGVKELERKLILKGYELGEIEQIIQYYLSIGYLNDEKLIVRVISYQISKDKNKKQIEMYLIGKGFDYQLIKSHLNEMNFKEIEEAIIEKQIIKRMEDYLLNESVLNITVFDEDSRFKSQGGFAKINKIFSDKLESVVLELNEYLYDDGGRTA